MAISDLEAARLGRNGAIVAATIPTTNMSDPPLGAPKQAISSARSAGRCGTTPATRHRPLLKKAKERRK